MKKKSKYSFILFISVSIYLTGCSDFFLNPSNSSSSSNTKLAITINNPVSDDTIGFKGANINFAVTPDFGINFIELYVNGVIHKWNPPNSDGSMPVIPLTLDSTYIGSRISYYLIYYDKDGSSVRSATINNLLITGIPPLIPYNFYFIRINNSIINVTWSDSSTMEQTGFEIWRKRGYYGNYLLKMVAAPGIYNTNDVDAIDTTVYFYKIRALNKYGTSNFSNEINNYGDGATHSIAPPTALKAYAQSSQEILLSWNDDIVGENYFKIERRYSWSSYVVAGTVSKNSTQFIDSANGLSPSTGYYYRVKAISGNDSSWSNEVYITTLAQ